MDSLKTALKGALGLGASFGADAAIPVSGDKIESGVRIGVQIVIAIVTLVQLIKERRKKRKEKKGK